VEVLAAVLKEFFWDMKPSILHLLGLGTTQTTNGKRAKHFQNNINHLPIGTTSYARTPESSIYCLLVKDNVISGTSVKIAKIN
jgi:hypothetical protein